LPRIFMTIVAITIELLALRRLFRVGINLASFSSILRAP
jgi:hypothetical protein